tara:strand:+ start:699 stop:1127 length:429 start_codon:yes stop_codon:yes gene_type:complete
LVHIGASFSQSFSNPFEVRATMSGGAIESNRSSYMTGHDNVCHHMGSVKAEVDIEGFGKAFDREFRCTVRRVRDVRSNSGPKPVDAAGVHYVALFASNEERQKCAASVIHPTPTDVESFFPRHSVLIGHETSAASDASVVEH